jgi:hypothetical protein
VDLWRNAEVTSGRGWRQLGIFSVRCAQLQASLQPGIELAVSRMLIKSTVSNYPALFMFLIAGCLLRRRQHIVSPEWQRLEHKRAFALIAALSRPL